MWTLGVHFYDRWANSEMQQSDSILLPVAPWEWGKLDEEGLPLALPWRSMTVQFLFLAFLNVLWSSELNQHQANPEYFMITWTRSFHGVNKSMPALQLGLPSILTSVPLTFALFWLSRYQENEKRLRQGTGVGAHGAAKGSLVFISAVFIIPTQRTSRYFVMGVRPAPPCLEIPNTGFFWWFESITNNNH